MGQERIISGKLVFFAIVIHWMYSGFASSHVYNLSCTKAKVNNEHNKDNNFQGDTLLPRAYD